MGDLVEGSGEKAEEGSLGIAGIDVELGAHAALASKGRVSRTLSGNREGRGRIRWKQEERASLGCS